MLRKKERQLEEQRDRSLALAATVSRLLTLAALAATVGFGLAQFASFHAATQTGGVGVWTDAFGGLGLRLAAVIGLWALRLWVPELMGQRARREFFLARSDAQREGRSLLPR